MTELSRNLIVDVNNVLWKVRYSEKLNKNRKETHVPQLLFYKFIEDINTYFKRFDANGVLCAFEGGSNWRKKVYPSYKVRDEADLYYEEVQEAIVLLREFLENNTAIHSISVSGAEADDVIAVVCQNKSEAVENIILSSDRDFVQLLKHSGVRLFSPQQDVERTSEDPNFDLFLKCIRGDASDNIFSAYPRVRKTKLEEAFYGEGVSYLNLMETVNKDGTKVGDRYQENRLLIDLEKQPEGIREDILTTIKEYTPGKFNQASAIKFARENGIKVLMEGFLSGKYTKLMNARFQL